MANPYAKTGSSAYLKPLIELTGDKELERKLENMSRSVQTKIARPALVAAIRVIANAQKQAAPTAAIKRTIGSKVRGDTAKAGAAVGKNTRQAQQMLLSHVRGGRQGVGISARNVHWLILGTQDRRTKKGAFHGRVKPNKFIKSATEGALSQAASAAADVARQKLAEVAAG